MYPLFSKGLSGIIMSNTVSFERVLIFEVSSETIYRGNSPRWCGKGRS